MQRFFGMMPSDEIKKEQHFKDGSGLSVTIQAGPNGWTILYADGSSEYKDVEGTPEENFDIAYKRAVSQLGELTSNTPEARCYEK